MKNFLLSSIFLFALSAQAQIITTIAGSDTMGYSGDGGPATDAKLSSPCHSTTDAAGNIYIADFGNNRIRKVDNNSGIITTIAGNGTGIHSGDNGPATSAGIDGTQGVAVDSHGNLFIAECNPSVSGVCYIRKIDTSGIITTIAGNGSNIYSGDNGLAIDAGLSAADVAVDKQGNIYVADFANNRIRKINTSGIITTVAGNGFPGFSGDRGLAVEAELRGPLSIAIDNATGNLYIADAVNDRIRKVDTAGIIISIAGNGIVGFTGDGAAATSAEFNSTFGVAADSLGNVYVADAGNNRIRMVNAAGIITTIAGDGTYSHNGDGGTATSAALYEPMGVQVDKSENIYITEYIGQSVRKVSGLGSVVVPCLFGNNGLQVWPSPNDGTFNVYASSATNEQLQISIADIAGQIIKETSVATNKNIALQIDVPPGIYVITAITNYGKQSAKVAVK